jgi:hypothetical protein
MSRPPTSERELAQRVIRCTLRLRAAAVSMRANRAKLEAVAAQLEAVNADLGRKVA